MRGTKCLHCRINKKQKDTNFCSPHCESKYFTHSYVYKYTKEEYQNLYNERKERMREIHKKLLACDHKTQDMFYYIQQAKHDIIFEKEW